MLKKSLNSNKILSESPLKRSESLLKWSSLPPPSGFTLIGYRLYIDTVSVQNSHTNGVNTDLFIPDSSLLSKLTWLRAVKSTLTLL